MSETSSYSDYAALVATETVRLERLLPGPVERVWCYLTDSHLRSKWLASGIMPPRAGGTVELVWRNDELTEPPGTRPEGLGEEYRMHSVITMFEPERRLAFTWGDGEVTFELEPHGDQVLLTVTHTRIDRPENLLMIAAGWHAHLDLLGFHLGDTQPKPFWDEFTRLRALYDRRLRP